MVPFATFWQRLKEDLDTCPLVGGNHAKRVQKWSAARGDMDGEFLVLWSGGDVLLCNTERDNAPRTISRAEFEKVYAVWQDYTAGAKGRSYLAHDLGVQNCTWVIPILYRHQHLMH